VCPGLSRGLSIRVEIVDKRQERDALKAQRALFVGEIYYTRTETFLSNHHRNQKTKTTTKKRTKNTEDDDGEY
jgi:hypothetical protein